MAQPTSNEELQLKRRARRRLIGAVVLVLVVVLGLPMVLDNEPRPERQDIDIRIPSPDAGTFKSKIVPIAPAPESRATGKSPTESARPSSPAPAPEAAPREDPAGKSAGPVASAPQVKPEPATSPSKELAQPAKPAAKGEAAGEAKQAPKRKGSHVVQVTALLNAEKAKEIYEQMRVAGIKAYTEVVTTEKGDVTRVRAGPFATREEAEKARSQLQSIGLDGKVTARKGSPE